jgi:hypothetical protein
MEEMMVDGEMLKVCLRVVTEDFLQTLIYGQVSAVHYHGNTGDISTSMDPGG